MAKRFAAREGQDLFSTSGEEAPKAAPAAKPLKPNQCATCKATMSYAFARGRTDIRPVHCTGPASAFIRLNYSGVPHHGRFAHSVCWKCGGSLGCDQCAGLEPLCKRCAAWGTAAGFAAHGPLLNSDNMVRKRHGVRAPEFAEYPEEFRQLYRQTNRDDISQSDWTSAPRPRIKTMPDPDAKDYDDPATPLSRDEQRAAAERKRLLRAQLDSLIDKAEMGVSR